MVAAVCPRAYWEGQASSPLAEEFVTEWRQHPALGGSGHPDFLACSWCGSLDPDDLMTGLREGRYFLGGTDKPYKWYVATGPNAPQSPFAKFYTPHLYRAAAEEFLRLWTESRFAHDLYVRPWLPSLAADAPDEYVTKMGAASVLTEES